MAELNVSGDWIISLVQLQAYFREEIAYGSEVFLDLLEYGRHGDIAEWLRENGEGALAKDVDAIAPSVGDAEYIVCLAQALTGNTSVGGDNLPVKPAFEDCLELVSIDTEKFGDKTQINIAIKVIKLVNETYELKLVTGWGTKQKSLTPYDYRQGETIEWEVTYQNRQGSRLGEIQFLVDGHDFKRWGKNCISSIGADTISYDSKSNTLIVGNTRYQMVNVVGGEYRMGACKEQGNMASEREKDSHLKKVRTFLMMECVVTQEVWATIMDSNPSKFKGRRRPVTNVSYQDCCTFIERLNRKLNTNFRLPNEAEWEYAARGGAKSRRTIYAGSNNMDKIAWYYENSNRLTHDVMQKEPNELGLYDMSGNVWEWCATKNHSYNGYSLPHSNWYINRGGCATSQQKGCRTTRRYCSDPSHKSCYLGFRIVI